jgi:hypothetical protein
MRHGTITEMIKTKFACTNQKDRVSVLRYRKRADPEAIISYNMMVSCSDTNQDDESNREKDKGALPFVYTYTSILPWLKKIR